MADQNQKLKYIITEEYKKCAKDPIYFFKKYVYIQHPQLGKIKFNLYHFQEKVLGKMLSVDYTLILKSRQLGISTLSASISLHTMLFNKDKNILVIATKQDVAKNIIQKVRYAYDHLPSWLVSPYVENNKLNLRLNNGSQVKAITSSGDAGRSEAVSMLIIDEAAFVADIEEIWGSAQQTLATGGRAIVLSTPNGVSNWFHRQWVDARNNKNKFETIRLHWSMHPDRDQAWRDEQDIILGPRLAAQECDADFLSSGDTLIDPDTLKFYKETFIQTPVEKRGPAKELWVWEHPAMKKIYIVSADVARGDGTDYSAFHVIDTENSNQVAEFKGTLGTTEFGNLLVGIATEYNDALLIIENATIGWAAIQQVINRGYRNLYYTKQDIKYVDVSKPQSNKIFSRDKKSVAGFTTSNKTRPLILSKLQSYFNNRDFNLNSERTLDELYAFVWNRTRPEAMKGYNDDLVISLAIGLWVRDTALELYEKGLASVKEAINQFTVPKINEAIIIPAKISAEDQWTMPISATEKEDLTWLL